MSEQANWRDDLTPDQQATVEKAARAAWEAHADEHEPWGEARKGGKDVCYHATLAVLRTVGVIPPAKVKTRGEVVAKLMVEPRCKEIAFQGVLGGPTKLLRHIYDEVDPTVEIIRGHIAAAIDAERDAAVKEYVASLPPPEDDPFDCRGFYDLMQTYHIAPTTDQARTQRAYEAVQDYCRATTRGAR